MVSMKRLFKVLLELVKSAQRAHGQQPRQEERGDYRTPSSHDTLFCGFSPHIHHAMLAVVRVLPCRAMCKSIFHRNVQSCESEKFVNLTVLSIVALLLHRTFVAGH